MGFCVASTRNGSGTGRETPAMDTWCSAMTSSSADCTFAGARLISSASTMLAITGPGSVMNSPVSCRNTRVPTMSEGTRSGVNWMREKLPPMTVANVDTASVLATPGTPSSRTWPPESMATTNCLHRCSWPTTTWLISDRTLRRSGVSVTCSSPCGWGRVRRVRLPAD